VENQSLVLAAAAINVADDRMADMRTKYTQQVGAGGHGLEFE
jgi:hypothetical protein